MTEVRAGSGFDQGRPRLTRQSAFTQPEVHPLVLDRLLADRYNVDWLVWEPETLWATLTKDFGLKTEISKHARAGIQAVKTIHANDTFFTDWQVTHLCTQALDGNLPDFDVLQDTEPAQIVHAVVCAKILRGDMPYGEEVQRWMAACFLTAGVVYAPPPVEFIQDEISMVEATCPNCGNIEWAAGLTECPACGTPGDQLSLSSRWQWGDVKERWDMVKNLDPANLVLREDRIGVQIARLFVIKEHVRDKMQLMATQLKELGYAVG